MYNEDSDCYTAAEDVSVEIAYTFDTFDPSIIIDNFQVLKIKHSTAMETCNLQTLMMSIDSRMSTLDFTLGIISNVMSQ